MNLAKHLTAFANQMGGWLFFGVKENIENMTAESFPGIDENDVSNLLTDRRKCAEARAISRTLVSRQDP